MASFESLSNLELRNKLLEHGYDLPISINREFLLKKLLSVTESNGRAADGPSPGNRRQTLATPKTNLATDKESSDAKVLAANAKNRLSLNAAAGAGKTGSGTRSSPLRAGGSDGLASALGVQNDARSNNTVKERRKSESPAVGSHTSTRKSTPSNSTPLLPVTAKRSLPFTKKNTIVEEASEDSESGVEFEEVPPAPARFLRQATSPAIPKKTPTSQLTRRSIHDPPKYRDEDLNVFMAGATPGAKEDRYKDYLKFFRGSGRGEELFGSQAGLKYSSQTYSEDESDGETEPESPSRIRTFMSSLSPSNLKPNLNGVSSWFSFGKAPALGPAYSRPVPTRLNNGHSSDWRGQPKPKAKGFFRSMFERNGAGSAAERANDVPAIATKIWMTAVLFFVFIGLCYYWTTSGVTIPGIAGGGKALPVPSKPPPSSASGRHKIPICGVDGVDPAACIKGNDVKMSVSLFNQLKGELVQRANWKGCGAEVEDKITLAAAKTLLYRLSDLNKQAVDNVFEGLLYLSAENPKWGLRVESPDSTEVLSATEIRDLDFTKATISAVNISPHFFCWVWSGFWNIVSYAVTFSILVAVLGALAYGFRYYQKIRKDAEIELFDFIEEILTLLHQHYEHALETESPTFLAVNHIRDELIPPKDRMSKSELWNKAEKYISENESRIREEIQHISGEEFRVWRWIPSASSLASNRKSLSPSPVPTPAHLPNLTSLNSAGGNQWQGQAFEMCDGSPNALPATPTPCLKIRQMFDANMNETTEQIKAKVDRAIREKCKDARIAHVGIEQNSAEGCVYIKCASKEDARNAYMALHGWWFDGHLLSVKFLREERYLQRFPEAKKF